MKNVENRGRHWQDFAACSAEDPELFFPLGRTGPALDQIKAAKAVCYGCEVVDVCLKFALETDSDHGVWGGLSENERRKLKSNRKRRKQS